MNLDNPLGVPLPSPSGEVVAGSARRVPSGEDALRPGVRLVSLCVGEGGGRLLAWCSSPARLERGAGPGFGAWCLVRRPSGS